MHGIFWELHQPLPQQAPGSDALTKRMLTSLPPLAAGARILDVGCGPGRQTLVLARESEAWVVAVDVLPPFLDVVRARAEEAELSDRIETHVMSMSEMSFDDASFELIWSEGAIYVMGFAAGLRAWRRLLRPRGHIVVSELSWLTKHPSREPVDYWAESYPGMLHIDDNAESARAAGYRVVEVVELPKSAWWNGYYDPLMARGDELRRKYVNDSDALAQIDIATRECALYRAHSASYGYVFYVLAIE